MCHTRRLLSLLRSLSLFELLLIVSSQFNVVEAMAPSSKAASVRFITNKMCPFAQKAWIALECTQTPYKLEQVSLYGPGGKPGWFLKLNPQGTVPVVDCNDGTLVLPDSDLILDEIGKKDTLLPKGQHLPDDPAWRQRINDMLPVGKRAVLQGLTGPLYSILDDMENAISDDSKFLASDEPTLADCHAFPFMWRLQQEFGFGKDYPKLEAWVNTCAANPNFQKTIQRSWWWWW